MVARSARVTLLADLPLLVLVAVGIGLRVLTMLAYTPALFFSDSWGYLFTAFTGHPVSFSYLRPNGYAALIRVLTAPGRDLQELVAVQHLSGVVIGVLVYVFLIRARSPRWLALIAAALVLLDGYRITLEQYVMPDTLFTLTLLVAALILVWPRSPGSRPGASAHAFAGLLLAASVIQREAALFAIPAFLLYLLSTRIGLRRLGVFVFALAVPVLAYAALYQARLGVFGLSESDGWTLYGRVAAFADCSGAGIPASEQRLCQSPAQRASSPDAGTWYIWDGSAPAAQLFHGGHQTRQIQERANRSLSDFADRVILHQPLDYLDASFSDFLRYFTPGARPFNDALSATSLPVRAADEARSESVRRRVLPSMRPDVGSSAGFVRAYRSVIHVPRPVLALLAIASLAALLWRVPSRREILLLSGAAVLIILGTAATAGFGLRYLLPAVPLLAAGGGLALRDLSQVVLPWHGGRLTARRSRRPSGQVSRPT